MEIFHSIIPASGSYVVQFDLGRSARPISGAEQDQLNAFGDMQVEFGGSTSITGEVSVASSSTGSASVTLASATLPAGFGVGSTLLGRTVTAVSGVTVTLNGNADATIAAPTDTAFTSLTLTIPTDTRAVPKQFPISRSFDIADSEDEEQALDKAEIWREAILTRLRTALGVLMAKTIGSVGTTQEVLEPS